MPEFIVLRYRFDVLDCWQQIGGIVEAADAQAAFRSVLLPPPNAVGPLPEPGEYRVVPLADSAHIRVEFTLHDLKASDNA